MGAPQPNQPAGVHYSSFGSLRSAHSELLLRERQLAEDADGASRDAFLEDVRMFIRRGQATGAILEQPAERTSSQSLLDYWATVICGHDQEAPDAVLREFDETLSLRLDKAQYPYFGIDAAVTAQAEFFFGRKEAVGQLAKRLGEQRLVIVSGRAGAGKTSLVLAGLVPALSESPLEKPDRPMPTVISPGRQPLRNLARAVLGEEPEADAFAKALLTDPARLAAVWTEKDRGLLVVDRAEELFTLCNDAEQRIAFLRAVREFSERPGVGQRAVIIIRSEYFGRMASAHEFAAWAERCHYPVPDWTSSELHEAITEPANLVGLKIEEAVVTEIVREIASEGCGLPLLQFLLRRLWDGLETNRISWPMFHRFKSAREALIVGALDLLGHMPSEDKLLAERMLLQMVGPESEAGLGRRRVLRRDLLALGDAQRAAPVLGDLLAAQLVRETRRAAPGEEQIDLAHRALLTDERMKLRRRAEVRMAAIAWEAAGKPEAFLLRNPLLEQTRIVDRDCFEPFENRFIAESEAARRRLRTMRRILIVLLGVVAVGAATGLGLAFMSVTLARDMLRRLDTERGTFMLKQNDPAEALLWFVRGREDDNWSITHPPAPEKDWQRTLFRRLQPRATRAAVHQTRLAATCQQMPALAAMIYEKDVASTKLSRDNQRLLIASARTGRVRVHDITTSRDLFPGAEPIAADGMQVRTADMSPDGRFVVVGEIPSDGGTAAIALWELGKKGPKRVWREELPGDGAVAEMWVATTHIGQHVAAGTRRVGGGGELHVWNVPSGKPVRLEAPAGGAVSLVRFKDSGKSLAAVVHQADNRDVVKVWSLTTEPNVRLDADSVPFDPPTPFSDSSNGPAPQDAAAAPLGQVIFAMARLVFTSPPHDQPIVEITLDAHSDRLVTASGSYGKQRGESKICTLSGRVAVNLPHQNAVTTARFSPDGRLVVTACDDALAHVWDASEGREIVSFAHDGLVKAATFSPDGRFIATGSRDQAARLWEVATGQSLPILPHGDPVGSVEFSEDGRFLVTVSRDLVRVWQVPATVENALPLRTDVWVKDAAFSGDLKFIATAEDPGESRAGTAHVWELKTEKSVAEIPLAAGEKGFTSVTLNGDGTLALTAAASERRGSQSIGLWRNGLRIGEAVQTALPVVSFAAFSPDGRWAAIACRTDNEKDNRGELIVLSVTGAAPQKYQKLADTNLDSAYHVAFAPGSDRLVISTGGIDPAKSSKMRGAAWLLQLAKGGMWGALSAPLMHEPPTEAIHFACFNHDASKVITASTDDMAYVWQLPGNAGTATTLARLRHQADVSCAAFSPDGSRIVTTSHDGTAQLWDGNGPGEKPLWVLRHDRAVNAAAFSVDKRWLVTASDDQTARLWDVDTGELAGLFKHRGQVRQVGFSADSGRLFSLSYRVTPLVRSGWPALPVPWGDSERFRPRPTLSYADGTPEDLQRRLEVHQWDLTPANLESALPRWQLIAAHTLERSNVLRMEADKLAEAWNRLPPATPPISWEANSQYYLAAAHECEHTEQWSGAVWHYSRLIERDARDGKKSAAILWFARATARANLQQWSEAADDANQALTLAQLGTSDQARALALRARGRLDSLREIESGDATEWEKIIADFEQAIKLDDKDRTLRSAAAEACVETFFAVAGESALPEKTRLQHAAKILAAAVAAEPEDARLRQWQAIAELTSGDLDRYRKTCEAMLEHFQNPDARAAGRIAWACLLNETFAKEHIDALLPWTTLAAQTTPSPYVLNTHGAALYRAGKYAEAIDVLTESIRSYDAREKARHQGDARQRGVAYREYKEGKPSEFAGLSGRAIDWVWLAMAHAQVNDMEKARQALERSRTSTEPLESRYLWTRLAIGLLDAEAESLLGANPK